MKLLLGKAVFMALMAVYMLTACNSSFNNGDDASVVDPALAVSDSKDMTQEPSESLQPTAKLNFKIVLAEGALVNDKYKAKFINADSVVCEECVSSVEENGRVVINWTVPVPAGTLLKDAALHLDEGHSRSSRFVIADTTTLKAQEYSFKRNWVLVKPQVSGIDSNSNYEFFTSDKANVTISGASVGYRFYLDDGGNVTLKNVNATLYAVGCLSNYIWSSSSKDLVITVEGTNTIRNPYSCYAIYSNRNLKMKGNGTLTVTVHNPNDRGLFASNYNSTGIGANALAAAGSTVTCSGETDNGDGTYSWTYTVKSK